MVGMTWFELCCWNSGGGRSGALVLNNVSDSLSPKGAACKQTDVVMGVAADYRVSNRAL